MTLSELKRRESELRRRLGDERYEQIYTRQQRTEATSKPATLAVSNKVENSFYTNQPDSGIMSNKTTITDIRKGIEDLSKKIENLNKQQYNTMLSGDDKKTAAYDGIIKNAEKQRDALKIQMARAMGIGSESAGRDNSKPAKGLDDSKDVPPLKVPGPFDDYVNEEDFNNPKDYYKELTEHAKTYYENGDEAGLKQFYYENKINEGLQRGINGVINDQGNMQKQAEITAPDGPKIIAITEDGNYREIGADNREEYRKEKAMSKAIERKIIVNASSDEIPEDIDYFHYMYDNVVAQQISIESDIPGQPKGENSGRMKEWYNADTEYILVGWNDGDNKAEIYTYYGKIDDSGKETITRERLNSIEPAELWFVWDETDPEACYDRLLEDTFGMGMDRLGRGNFFSPRGSK